MESYAIALIDSNNFYAACEQSVDPSVIDRPLVVLSNNDGCIIARNAEAKALNIAMGQPYFRVQNKLRSLDVEVRSSNYALYADMSQRLMSLIKANCEELEVYSIDEAFARIRRPLNSNLNTWARRLREIIYQRLSLSIAIGIGANKSQSKLANYLAKTTASHSGIFDLERCNKKDEWLEKVEVKNIWGIGRKTAHWCHLQGIHNARQFRDMPSYKLKRKYGVTIVRLQHELKGESCLKLLLNPKSKKETCVSRSFSRPISQIEELRQAIANYVVRAGEKLRKQQQLASVITIFTRTSLYAPIFYSRSATQRLDIPSNDTPILLSAALDLTEKIFSPNHLLMKAGIIMQELRSEESLQLYLFSNIDSDRTLKKESLMKTIDTLNNRYGQNTVQWAICGINKEWAMSRKHLSASATTRLAEIPIVII